MRRVRSKAKVCLKKVANFIQSNDVKTVFKVRIAPLFLSKKEKKDDWGWLQYKMMQKGDSDFSE